MKHKLLHIIYFIVPMFFMVAMAGCTDDFDYDINGDVKEGKTVIVPISIEFDKEETLDLNTRAIGAQPGNSIQNIKDFWMLIYGENKNLLHKFRITIDADGNCSTDNSEISNMTYKGDNDNRLPEEGNLQDNAAGYLRFNLKLDAHPYYIYGVANVDDFNTKDVSTIEKLKNIECTWNENSLAKNSEMYGIFSIGQNRHAVDDSPITLKVNGDGQVQLLHCWLKRLASKVTVAFDGSELYDDVEVYIESIKICDIPKMCTLGVPNHPGHVEDGIADADKRYSIANGVIADGGSYIIQTLSDSDKKNLSPNRYYHVCNASHIYGGPEAEEDDSSNPIVLDHKHDHTAQSLFFYENLQGEKGKNKAQSADGSNIDYPDPKENDLTSGWKDHKAYGTYIEVSGYYRNTSGRGAVSEGPIKYRFMLGQDVIDNYNAYRNTHYKLTLKLRGYANDYDWHIDYKEDTGIYMTSPQYISYLYNKSMYASIRIKGEMDETYGLQAEILDDTDDNTKFTPWGPWGDDKADVNGNIEFPDPSGVTINGHPFFINTNGKTYTEDGTTYKVEGASTSFLSLRKTTVLRIEPDGISDDQSYKTKFVAAYNLLSKSFEPKKKRTYAVTPKGAEAAKDKDDGPYTVQEMTKNGDVVTERLFRIPLFTRAKELVTRTGMSGNNPYTAYPRKMKVKFTAKIKNENGKFEVSSFILDVIQVRRIINPKGVWREKGSSKKFTVTLMRKLEDTSEKFTKFNSIGKWSAEVVSQSDNVITLSSTTAGSGSRKPQQNQRRIEGEDEHPIDFDINFHGASSGFAVIRVRYHNYTCEHDIFCMVGKEPVQMDPTKKIWWMPTNVYRFNADGTPVYAANPLQEGSLFLRGSTDALVPHHNPVDDVEEIRDESHQFHVKEKGSNSETKKTWSQLCTTIQKEWDLKVPNVHVAECEKDFYSIADASGNIAFPIKKAYGVLYGEGADAPAEALKDAYGYDSPSGANSPKGMRGVFVYNENNVRTIFLPLGKSGHGRRKTEDKRIGWLPNPPSQTGLKPGTMRYSTRDLYNAAANGQPLLADLYRRPGALYWCSQYTPNPATGTLNVKKSSSFDINFYTLGFEGFTNGSIALDEVDKSKIVNTDACFIRTVTTVQP